MDKAQRNGVNDLQRLTHHDVQHLEPNVRSLGGLRSPSTGIVDSHGYMMALLGDFENHGGMVAYETTVLGGRQQPDGLMFELDVLENASDPTTVTHISARRVINAAGLVAPGLTNRMLVQEKELPSDLGQHYAKGNYFSLAGPSPFQHLIYPVPVAGGLGVHATLDLGGQVRFGPDVEWVKEADNYTVDVKRADQFYEEIRKYYPDLPNDSLTADYSGIR